MTTIIITGRRSISPTERYAVRSIVVPWLVDQGVTRVVHGGAWPRRYNGSARAEQYLVTWRAVRARAARILEVTR